ncbi:MAG TPA: hypothetical protein DIW86_07365 [Pseudomonas sp.]|nr:hypothetical protein [Pseudomonas sp.]
MPGKRAERVGGVVLMRVGATILYEHLSACPPAWTTLPLQEPAPTGGVCVRPRGFPFSGSACR